MKRLASFHAWSLGLVGAFAMIPTGPVSAQGPPVAPGNLQPPAGQPNLTRDNGVPVGSDDHYQGVGPDGPALLDNAYLIEKIARFNRERIPERVVHARGIGAMGEFVATHDVSSLTKAKFLAKVGEKTPVFARFSTVVMPTGSADTARDVRGFAVKFRTEEGNYDLLCNSLPVFFVRNTMRFVDLVHAFKPSPLTNIQEPERFFDFFAAMPESTNVLTYLFSDDGTPASFRQIDAFGVNTFKWVNSRNEVAYIKYRWSSQQGRKNNTHEDAMRIGGEEPATLTHDLIEAIENKDFPSWELQVQAVRPADLRNFEFDPLDATKIWPESVVPFQPVGKLTLNKMPENYFESTEQVAFNAVAFVPGIEASEDKLFAGRLFAYADAQNYRLGVNAQQIPVNQPRHPVANINQDGLDDHAHRAGDINYSPSIKRPGRLVADPKAEPSGAYLADRVKPTSHNEPQDYKQAGEHYLTMGPVERDRLAHNLTVYFKKVKNRDIVARMVGHFAMANGELGRKLAEANKVDVDAARKLVLESSR